jgi:hypothetical protein
MLVARRAHVLGDRREEVERAGTPHDYDDAFENVRRHDLGVVARDRRQRRTLRGRITWSISVL